MSSSSGMACRRPYTGHFHEAWCPFRNGEERCYGAAMPDRPPPAVAACEHGSAPDDPVVYAGDEVTTRRQLDEMIDSLRTDFAAITWPAPASASSCPTAQAPSPPGCHLVERCHGAVNPAPAVELERSIDAAAVTMVLTSAPSTAASTTTCLSTARSSCCA
jgi:hypothetical protein